MSTSLAVLYAVVVGWNGSPSPDVPRLRYADDDAVEYARLLGDAGARVTLLTELDGDSRALHTDARPDGRPTREGLLAALDRIDGEIQKDGRPAELFIVYSGHGDVDHGEGFIALDGGRVTRTDLYDRVLAGRRADRIHVIVDACKSYFLVYARGGERRAHLASFVDERTPDRLPRVGFALSTSADNDSHEWEEFQGGVFSHEVRSALRGAGDADGDGRVSYAELGAFVRRANAAVPNPRFRPRFTVVAPSASTEGGATPVLGWPARAAAASRDVIFDGPALGRVSVEDAVGRRLADAHLGGAATTLHLPAATPLYVWSRADDREYALAPSAEPVRISMLTSTARRIGRRGALGEAFTRIFALPFDAAVVADYLAHPEPAADDEPAPLPPARRRARVATLAIAATTVAAAVACNIVAGVVRQQAAVSTQDARVAANDRISSWNAGAIGLYAAGGAAAAAFAILSLWPQQKAPQAPPRVTIAPGPGPGEFGLSLSGSWR